MFRQPLVLLLVVLAACDVRVEFGDGGRGGGAAGGGVTAGGSVSSGGSAAGGAAGGTNAGGAAGGTNAGGAAGGAAGGTNAGGAAGGAPMVACSASQPCAVGQCFNGLCAATCQSDASCRTDEFCDTQGTRLCHPRSVMTCASGCASNQMCVSGFCSVAPAPGACDPTMVFSGNDGCATNALCHDPIESMAQDPKCYSFPACAADRTCPPGVMGAVCNDALLPNKGLICLTGYCRTVANCPANWLCVKVNTNDVLGICGNRGIGSPCVQPSDCQSNSCFRFTPFAPGFCQ